MSVSGHLWTITPRLRHRLRPPRIPASRPWATVIDDPVAGPVRVTGRLSEVPGSGELLLLVHGLGGDTGSHYLSGGLAAAEAAGISTLRINLRGADRQGTDFYHAGLTDDLHAALASPELGAYRRLYVLGYSLGGHVALRLGTEAGDPRLAAVAAIGAPIDLALSQREIDAPPAWLYRPYLLWGVSDIYAPGHPPPPPPRGSPPPPRLALPAAPCCGGWATSPPRSPPAARCRCRFRCRWRSAACAPSASGTTAWWRRATASPTPPTTTAAPASRR